MTRAEEKQLLPIIQAYAEGKTIEFLTGGTWVAMIKPTKNFKCKPSNYSIKPEPKYRPFKTQEECWNEMHKHPDFGWLYCKANGYYIHIRSMGDQSMNGQKFADAFSDYLFPDGEPFGIMEE